MYSHIVSCMTYSGKNKEIVCPETLFKQIVGQLYWDVLPRYLTFITISNSSYILGIVINCRYGFDFFCLAFCCIHFQNFNCLSLFSNSFHHFHPLSSVSLLSTIWHWCYYPQLPRDALSPVCRLAVRLLWANYRNWTYKLEVHDHLKQIPHMGDFTWGGEWLLTNITIFYYGETNNSLKINMDTK